MAVDQGGRCETDFHVVTDRDTGRPRGFGFLERGTEADAQATIQYLDGAELDGCDIQVNEVQER